MELSNGVVVSVTFHNEDNGFSVVKIIFNDSNPPVTCVGTMPLISPGSKVSVSGHWETHRRFGKQFYIENYTLVHPTTIDGITTFLSSGIISNIGPAKAKQIVDRFGLETLKIIEDTPNKLCEISGIGKKTVEKIVERWNREEHLRKLLLFLQNFDVSLTMAIKIYKEYGIRAQEIISKNPYALYEDIWGIGFLKADHIAQKMGFSQDSYKRILAGLTYIMDESSKEGHSCLPASVLRLKATELLQVSDERVLFSLDHMIAMKMLIKEGEWIFLPYLYLSEKSVARDICRQMVDNPISDKSESKIEQWLDEYEKKYNWHADPLQRQAVIKALFQACLLLTGGPGTGKTTVLKVLVAFFKEQKKSIVLTAPTGRAAQRLKDITGITAQTIHRLLEYKPYGKKGGYFFSRNENNPLDADVIIVDEVSMIDVQLMSQLCAAVKSRVQLIFVGDCNQLPSVGAGNVLSDMIDSGIIPHIHLTTVFRQARSSRIITAAHEINNGITPVFNNLKGEDCFFLEKSDPQEALDLLIDLVSRRIPSSFHLNPVHDIQVLSPMHKGLLGTDHINKTLQEILRSSSDMVQNGQHCFYLGDKVMQVRNNYEKNIFNGDIGIVVKVVDKTGLIVDYQGNYVTYESALLEELLPAYCISIHKSQGCEFKAVVIPVMTQHFIMLQRNLIYTALTRAKDVCVFIGDQRALQIAIQSNKAIVRYSCLCERLKAGFNNCITN